MDLTLQQSVLQALHSFSETLSNSREITDSLVDIWTAVMEQAGLSADEVRFAAQRVLATEKFFPAPATVIEAARPSLDVEVLGERAWQQMRETLKRVGCRASLAVSDFNGDGTALWTIERIGWERLGEQLGEDNQALLHAEFIRTYRVGCSERRQLAYFAGQFERENDAQGRELTPTRVGRPDWSELPSGERMLPAPGILEDLKE